MKIVLISTFDMLGGAAIAAQRLHKGLRSIRQDSWMLVKQKDSREDYIIQADPLKKENGIDKKILRIIERLYCNFNRTAMSNTAFSLPYLGYDLSGKDMIRHADIINLHWVTFFQSLNGIASLLELDKPVVWTLHDQNSFTGGCHYSAGCLGYQRDCYHCPQLRNKFLQLPAGILKTKGELWRNNLTIVSPSHWLAECAKKSSVLGKFRIEVIPNSLETDKFIPLDKAAAKEALGLTREQIVLLFSAYSDQEKRKGFSKLREALSVCLRQPRFRELTEKGIIQIMNLGPRPGVLEGKGFNVLNLGIVDAIDKMVKVYAAADILVMPSLEENLSNVMLEAMSCQTPVLAFAVGGTPDVVQNGLNGFLAPAYDTDTFAALLLELIFNKTLREQMGLKGRLLMEEKFKLRDQAVNYLGLYHDLLKIKMANNNFICDDESSHKIHAKGAVSNE